jgi:hypothetical protein
MRPISICRMPWDREPLQSFVVTNNRTTILPLPAGEGRGEGESFERESRAVHGEGESFGQECAVHGKFPVLFRPAHGP